MTRRLTPFNQSLFKVTIKKTGEGSKEDSVTFHSRGFIRTWSRFLEETLNMGIINPSSELSSQQNWSLSDVSDPTGGLYQQKSVSFQADYQDFSVSAERILTIQESNSVDVTRLVYLDSFGSNVQFSFEESDQDKESTLSVLNRSDLDYPIQFKCENKNVARTLTALGSLVGLTVDQGVDWSDTADVGTLVG